MMAYTIPLMPIKPQTTPTAPIVCHGALIIANNNSTTAKCADARCRKGGARLRISAGVRRLGNEGYYDELQSDQRARRRADDYVKAVPVGELCHVVRLISRICCVPAKVKLTRRRESKHP